MDVRPAADCARITEHSGDRVDRLNDILRGVRPGLGGHLPQRRAGEHGAGPGPEVLCREVLPGDFLQILVHVARSDLPPLAVLVDVLKEFLAWKVAAVPDDPRQAATADAGSSGERRSCRGTRIARWRRGRRRAGRAAWSGRTIDSTGRTHRCRRGSGSSRAAARRSPAPSRAAARDARDRRRCARGFSAARRRRPAAGRTSFSSREARQSGWYRYCLRPRASRPVA